MGAPATREKNMKFSEFFLLFFFIFLGLFCALAANEPAFSLQKDYLGATGYPRMVGFALAALSLVALLRGLYRLKISGTNAATQETPSLLKSAEPVALAIIYVAGIAWFGFIISTFTYLFIMPRFLGSGSSRTALLKNLLYALLITGIIEAFFKIFKIYLPATLLF